MGTIIQGRTRKQKEQDEAFLKEAKKLCTKKPVRLPQGYSFSFQKMKEKYKNKQF